MHQRERERERERSDDLALEAFNVLKCDLHAANYFRVLFALSFMLNSARYLAEVASNIYYI